MDRGENNNKYLKLSSFACFGQSIEQQKPLNIGLLPQRERIIFQSSILRGLLLVSGRASQQASKQTNKTNKQNRNAKAIKPLTKSGSSSYCLQFHIKPTNNLPQVSPIPRLKTKSFTSCWWTMGLEYFSYGEYVNIIQWI